MQTAYYSWLWKLVLKRTLSCLLRNRLIVNRWASYLRAGYIHCRFRPLQIFCWKYEGICRKYEEICQEYERMWRNMSIYWISHPPYNVAQKLLVALQNQHCSFFGATHWKKYLFFCANPATDFRATRYRLWDLEKFRALPLYRPWGLKKFQAPSLHKPWDLEKFQAFYSFEHSLLARCHSSHCLLHIGTKLSLQTYSSTLWKCECLGRLQTPNTSQWAFDL